MPIVEVQYPIPDFPNYMITKSGAVWSYVRAKPRRLHPHIGSGGAPTVMLKGNGPRSQQIHRLLAMTFIKNPNPKKFNEVGHKDLDPLNYSLSNLVWCSRQEIAVAGAKYYSKNAGGRRKRKIEFLLSEKQVKEIRGRYEAGSISQARLAKMYGTSQYNVSLIVRRRGWEWVK